MSPEEGSAGITRLICLLCSVIPQNFTVSDPSARIRWGASAFAPAASGKQPRTFCSFQRARRRRGAELLLANSPPSGSRDHNLHVEFSVCALIACDRARRCSCGHVRAHKQMCKMRFQHCSTFTTGGRSQLCLSLSCDVAINRRVGGLWPINEHCCSAVFRQMGFVSRLDSDHYFLCYNRQTHTSNVEPTASYTVDLSGPLELQKF